MVTEAIDTGESDTGTSSFRALADDELVPDYRVDLPLQCNSAVAEDSGDG
jgi:hypothetical protein